MILTDRRLRLRDRFWLWWRVRVRPSRLQRLHNQGDPTGEVRRAAEQIIAEMKADGSWDA